MDQLGEGIGIAARPGRVGGVEDAGEATLEVVLDRLDVVDRLALDLRELGDVGRSEVLDDRPEPLLLARAEGADAGDDAVGAQVDEPLDLDADPLPVEGGLGQVVDEGGDGATIAAVESAERDGRVDLGQRRHVVILPDASCLHSMCE